MRTGVSYWRLSSTSHNPLRRIGRKIPYGYKVSELLLLLAQLGHQRAQPRDGAVQHLAAGRAHRVTET